MSDLATLLDRIAVALERIAEHVTAAELLLYQTAKGAPEAQATPASASAKPYEPYDYIVYGLSPTELAAWEWFDGLRCQEYCLRIDLTECVWRRYFLPQLQQACQKEELTTEDVDVWCERNWRWPRQVFAPGSKRQTVYEDWCQQYDMLMEAERQE